MLATSKKIRFTVDEYFRMSEAGIFDDHRVELLQGRIFRMHAQAHPHRWAVSRSAGRFFSLFSPPKYWVVVQGTLRLGKFGAPDPDLHVFDALEGTPDEKLPPPFIVLEISDRTYRKDSGIKLRLYAEAGIAEYWIANVREKRIEVYRQPQNPTGLKADWRYAERRDFHGGERIKLLAFPNFEIGVDEILPG